MKLNIDFDLEKYIEYTKKPFAVSVLKNAKYYYIWQLLLFTLPGITVEELIAVMSLYSVAPFFAAGTAQMMLNHGIRLGLLEDAPDSKNAYKYFARIALEEIVPKLGDINVNTTYDKLVEAEVYESNYHFEIYKNAIPLLKENKYILVPGFNSYNGEEIEISILQEHYIGTRDYELSVGEPEKKRKKVLATSRV